MRGNTDDTRYLVKVSGGDNSLYCWPRETHQRSVFRYELASYGILLMLFRYIGAIWQQILLLTGLAFGVFAIEVINTAIEVIVDHISPEWSEMAK